MSQLKVNIYVNLSNLRKIESLTYEVLRKELIRPRWGQ